MKIQNITVKKLSELCGLTARRLYQLADEGKIPKCVDGSFPRDETMVALFKWFDRDSEKLRREKLLLAVASREQKEHDLATSRGKFVERSEARFAIQGAAREAHAMVRREVEINSPQLRRDKLTELGAAPEIVANFHEWDIHQSQAVIDRIETRYAAAGKAIEAIPTTTK